MDILPNFQTLILKSEIIITRKKNDRPICLINTDV